MAWDHTQAEEDVRTILSANLDASLIAFWDDTSFDPPKPTGDVSSRVKWYDCELRPQGKLISDGFQQLTVGATRPQTYILEVGICFEDGLAGSGLAALTEAEAIEGYFTSADTSTMIYRVTEAHCEEVRVWQDVWLLLPWILEIERYED